VCVCVCVCVYWSIVDSMERESPVSCVYAMHVCIHKDERIHTILLHKASVCLLFHTHVYTFKTHMRARTYTRIRTYILRTRIHTYIHIHYASSHVIYIYIYIYIYTHTHTLFLHAASACLLLHLPLLLGPFGGDKLRRRVNARSKDSALVPCL
jgi:hypothetical protein